MTPTRADEFQHTSGCTFGASRSTVVSTGMEETVATIPVLRFRRAAGCRSGHYGRIVIRT
jgi:hypothetical protein